MPILANAHEKRPNWISPKATQKQKYEYEHKKNQKRWKKHSDHPLKVRVKVQKLISGSGCHSLYAPGAIKARIRS